MKTKLFSVLFLVMALTAWVACGSSDTGGTSDTTTPDAAVGDTAKPDTFVDVPVGTDTAKPDTNLPDNPVNPDQPGDQGQPETSAEACVANCMIDGNEAECGDDGCNGSCGECPAEKPVCNAGKCEASTCQLPTTWSKAGAINTAKIPSNATGCPVGNDLSIIASFANKPLQDAIDKGDFGVIMEFRDVTDFDNTASFFLAGLLGAPETTGSSNFLLDKKSYKADDCSPLIAFDGASISSGALEAGPSDFYLNLPIEQLGGNLEMTLKMAMILASITDDTVAATNGFVGGYALKDDLDPIFQGMIDQCKVDPNLSFCSYTSYFSLVNGLYKDYDVDGTGAKKKALAVCLAFTLKGATVTGYKP